MWTPLPLHKVKFDIKVCIFVLEVQSPAVLYNLLDLGLACGGSLFVRCDCILEGASFPRSLNGSSFGIEVVWKDSEQLARVFCGELLPESVNALLSGDILAGLLRGKRRL